MYGTIAVLKAKPGAEAKLLEQFREKAPGMMSYIYRMDTNAHIYYLAVMFESKAAYLANANSPEQQVRYNEMLKLLTAKPEWHDGEVIHENTYGL